MNFLLYFVLASGIYSLIGSLSMHTTNLRSAIIFKVIPFFFGVAVILYFLKEIKFI